jgi:predicted amidohydrolase YtcJ
VKGFADGSLGSKTALFWESYAGEEGDFGGRPVGLEVIQRGMRGAAQAGLQVGVHAIGDRAVDEVCEMMEELVGGGEKGGKGKAEKQSNSRSGVRHRIEHVQHISGSAAAACMAAASIIAVTNPLHLVTDREVMKKYLGPARAGPGRAFAYKTLVDAGVKLAHASDWPIVEVDPLGSVYAAAFRKELGDGREAWVPTEGLSVEQALLGHTRDAAAAVGMEGDVGVLKAGMKADFVVLSHALLDWTGGKSDKLPQVLATYLGGRKVYGHSPAGVQ